MSLALYFSPEGSEAMSLASAETSREAGSVGWLFELRWAWLQPERRRALMATHARAFDRIEIAFIWTLLATLLPYLCRVCDTRFSGWQGFSYLIGGYWV